MVAIDAAAQQVEREPAAAVLELGPPRWPGGAKRPAQVVGLDQLGGRVRRADGPQGGVADGPDAEVGEAVGVVRPVGVTLRLPEVGVPDAVHGRLGPAPHLKGRAAIR